MNVKGAKYKGVESIGVSAPVYETDDEMEAMRKGIAHYKTTSAWNGNIGVCAHNGTASYCWFRDLHKLEKGDVVTYQTALGTRTYQISEIKEVDETDWSMLGRAEDNRITIVCFQKKFWIRYNKFRNIEKKIKRDVTCRSLLEWSWTLTTRKETANLMLMESKLKELEQEFDQLLILAANGDELMECRLQKVSESILKLKQQKKQMEQMAEHSKVKEHWAKELMELISDEDLDLTEYSDTLVYRIVEKVTVLSKEEIRIRFIGGFEVAQRFI